MKTVLYYFSGTGNSLWAARMLARELPDAEIAPMPAPGLETVSVDAPVIGLVFPVYIWGLPARVRHFADKLKGNGSPYIFAIATNGGQVANTLVQLQQLMARNGRELASGFDLVMPSNYIPWGSPGPRRVWEPRCSAALEKLSRIAGIVRSQEKRPVEKGPLWHRVVFTLLYKLSHNQIPKMDKSFWVDEKCNSCGICVKICPSKNITMSDTKPVWNHGCEQCLACIQWCPRLAIQFGKKTPRYERYHHPEITLRDMIGK
ncbi:MAG: hypothetical protein A2268_01500 [Candidatus Raymondbacteria bacterium RifOxyA12_full_50_37]|uniref:4Fe-4S ferredoxin-type domain-containing protein n=1 Tax=Candidatus Raymondbacteria bacterium RIFOXYD12_FULL_49_13 TaxID=1817890 RepID=A0A1F7F9C8_UNCRA|nr:MAG: hypothetical protein A2268_01500 [Candidatus Raymondbacteria bacterium RifOxyA12_full_50_37]OGJ87901.1 MAG: hypothetical protein A2248_01785 [Candidatus Raymondbacteria bacterium RIFOXYA2_FULL_49_16]OGJ89189.1 MAG: hypothetical protein A2350_01805 [Candidatus Raymondbacteria bacterium RifOxyB12_full_50_8]OGJ93585.1 MAG: hypothetical protein A2487_07240 [Candidatus Raymondbacteria bacterium RifOxyC12_full_50_8]OGK03233.1 MAG: hypothetical protein A2519_13260 [Candidatus Raymondbacteria b